MPRIHIAVLITHLAGWLLFLNLPVVFITSNGNVAASEVLLSSLYWLRFLYFAFIFYLHTYLLVPLLHHRQKKLFYFLNYSTACVIHLMGSPFRSFIQSEEPSAV
jgi:hypothetical protein